MTRRKRRRGGVEGGKQGELRIEKNREIGASAQHNAATHIQPTLDRATIAAAASHSTPVTRLTKSAVSFQYISTPGFAVT